MTELNEEKSAKRWALAAHISVPFSFILPIPLTFIPLFIRLRKKQIPFVREQAKQSLNFQISLIIYFFSILFISLGICYYSGDPNLVAVGWIFAMAFYELELVFALIVAIIKVRNMASFSYPLTIAFLKPGQAEGHINSGIADPGKS
jgi:uncharacterized protein